MREQGTIKKYFLEKGFGFVQRPGAPDLFFHVIDRLDDYPIVEGVTVEFDVQDTPKGPRAVEVEIIDYTTAG